MRAEKKQSFYKKYKTALAVTVITILVAIVAVGTARKAEAAEYDAILGLGYGINHTSGTVETIGFQVNGTWYAEARIFEEQGEGSEAFEAYSAGRVARFREDKRISPYGSLGAVYMSDNPKHLVGCDIMFQLGVGFEFFRILQLGYTHISSADRCRPNDGIDWVELTYRWRF